MTFPDVKSARSARPRRVSYPDGDGKPMAETAEHREAMNYAIEALQGILSDRPDVWVSGNDFVYYREGDPTARVSPDCYAALGIRQRVHRSYKMWEQDGQPPNLVIEFTSRKTARADQEAKFDLYQNVLRVPEYLLFDPLGEYLRPRFQGFRLVNGMYRPIVPDDDGRIVSAETGATFFADGRLLRCVDPRTGAIVPTMVELREQKAAADAELARLRAEIEALRGRQGGGTG